MLFLSTIILTRGVTLGVTLICTPGEVTGLFVAHALLLVIITFKTSLFLRVLEVKIGPVPTTVLVFNNHW